MSSVDRDREPAAEFDAAADREDVGPYLDLAREIRAQVARIAADPSAHSDVLFEYLEEIPREERRKLARRIFAELPAGRQWEVIAEVYGDDEITEYLEVERAARLAEARASAERLRRVRAARVEHRLDTRDVPAGELLTLGLFRERDVAAAVRRGQESSTCARRLVLRSLGAGAFQVIADVFNPRGGYFVTAEYSEDTWRDDDRLPGHAVVRVGAIIDGPPETGPTFEPVLYPGGRTDFEVGGEATRGHLHLGFGILDDIDIFVR
jgi:hypothetical protein